MKLLILFLALSFISCEREMSSPKELVYFHIIVTGDPFVASVTLDKPAESAFRVRFEWFDSEGSHRETLAVKPEKRMEPKKQALTAQERYAASSLSAGRRKAIITNTCLTGVSVEYFL